MYNLQIYWELGARGSSTVELLMVSREIRKDPAAQTPPMPANPLRVASWNVRTLYEAGKSSEFANETKRNKLDILGVCETHLMDY